MLYEIAKRHEKAKKENMGRRKELSKKIRCRWKGAVQAEEQWTWSVLKK